MAKIFQFGDLHDVRRYGAVKDFLNSRTDIDVAVFVGDAFSAHLYSEEFHRVQEEGEKNLKNPPSEEDQQVLQIAQMVQQNGGIEALEKAIEKKGSDQMKEKLMNIIAAYREHESFIPEIEQRHAKFIEENQEQLQEMQQKGLEAVLKLAEKDAKTANKELSQVKQKIVGVPGNHDLNNIYDHLTAIHWLDRQGPLTVAGIRFGGMINCEKRDYAIGIPEVYTHFEQDVPQEQVEAFMKQNASEEALVRFYANNPVIKRFKGESIDCLVTHKGFDSFSGNFSVGAGAKKAFEDMKPKLKLCGHLHGRGTYDDTKGYQGLKSSERFSYVIHTDDNTKQIQKIEVYEWVYE